MAWQPAPHELKITATEGPGTRVLRLAGEFDLNGVSRFERQLARDPDSEVTAWIIDLRGLTFMDSSGLRALVLADRRARAEGVRLVVVRGPGQIDRLLELTGVGGRIELVDQPPEVIADDPR